MAREKQMCHICGNKVKKEGLPSCASCGADFLNPQNEAVASIDKAVYSKGLLSTVSGSLILTNQRLLFSEPKGNGVGYAVGGLVGAAISAAVNSGAGGNIIFSLPLSDVASVTDGKRNTFEINTKDGKIYKLTPDKAEEWKAYLRSLPGVTSA